MTLAHKSPIVDFIVFNLIREVRYEKFKFSKDEIIDPKIIPPTPSSLLVRKGFRESRVPQNTFVPLTLPPFGSPKSDRPNDTKVTSTKDSVKSSAPEGFQESILSTNVSPEIKPVVAQPPIPNPSSSVNQTPKPIVNQSQSTIVTRAAPRAPPVVPINLFQNPPNYGKLNPILKDPFVSFIECPGPGMNLIVTKRGQKQRTNISLSREEIQMLLANVSSKTKIPLISGVFRVGWDNLVINAIISDVLPPKFVLKKGP